MDINRLIFERGEQGHLLAQGITPDEASTLSTHLIARFNPLDSELDFSPKSLSRLDRGLIKYHKALSASGKTLSEDETLELVRELAAYLGKVLAAHSAGLWITGPTLWGTHMEFSRNNPSKTLRVSLGNIAGNSWDCVLKGLEPRLYEAYRRSKQKTVHQKLKKL